MNRLPRRSVAALVTVCCLCSSSAAFAREVPSEQSQKETIRIVIDVLKGDDQAMHAVVIGLLREIRGTEMIKAVAAELPNLSVGGQVQLLSALGDSGDSSALPAVVKAADTEDESVRVAALKALGRLGDASTVAMLAQRAAGTTGVEREAARQSLYRLHGPKVEESILQSIPGSDPKVKVELLRSLSERRAHSAAETLLKTARDSDRRVRLESLKALKVVANKEHLPALVDLLIHVRTQAERDQAEKTVAVVAHKIKDENRQAETVLAVLPSVKAVPARCSLLSVLGRIGDDSALAVLRAALGERDDKVRYAAVRALSNWPNAKPLADLLQVARQSDIRIHRILALRGYIRMVGLPADRSADETLKMYRAAMGLAERPEEKRQVLAGIPKVPTVGALDFVEPYLRDETVQAEAKVAYMAIAVGIRPTHQKEADAAFDKLRQVGGGKIKEVSKGPEVVLTPMDAIITPPMQMMTDGSGVLHTVVTTEGVIAEIGQGGRAVYNFSAAEGGTLELEFYVNCRGITNDSWYVRLDENPYVTWNDNATEGWEWRKFPNQHAIGKGEHLLIIDQREDGAMMSNIKLILK
jgi:HEAT repeat protein